MLAELQVGNWVHPWVGTGLGWASTSKSFENADGKKSIIFIAILLITFRQHLIINPVLDTNHIYTVCRKTPTCLFFNNSVKN